MFNMFTRIRLADAQERLADAPGAHRREEDRELALYTCIYIYTYTYIYIYIYMWIYIYIYTHMYKHICVCMHACMYV